MAKVPLTKGSVSEVVAPCISVVLYAPVVAKFPANAKVPVVTVSAVAPELTITALFPLPEIVGRRLKPDVMLSNSDRKFADAPGAPVVGYDP